MLIVRAPVRISLAGGGTDLPAYYERFGGVVINTTIDKYFYVFLNVLDKDSLQISSSDYRTFYRHAGQEPLLWDGDLRLPRAILSHFGLRSGLSMFLASEIPPGTGLGSSSTVTVAIVKGLSTALNAPLDKGPLAELACHIEIEKLGEPIGKQDQYAAAFGGLNWIEFSTGGVRVERLRLAPEVSQQLEQNLMLFFTGATRNASEILAEQSSSSRDQDPQVIQALHRVKAMASDVRRALEQGDLRAFGEMLHANWEQKKRFAQGVSNSTIDELYALARGAGAIGGKITGAGGGGFLLLYCEAEYQAKVTDVLESHDLRRMDFRFECQGARVLMNTGLPLGRFAQGEALQTSDACRESDYVPWND
jgi:D-glycero-alpha-D-manno-heptose-7-phosphate kinase